MNRPTATRLRPLKICGLSLTNVPNNRGGQPLTTITNRSGNKIEDVSTLTPREAGEHCLALANRIKTEHGISFDAAWSQARGQQPALFNRMATAPARPVVSAPNSASASPVNFQMIAGHAMRAMVEEDRKQTGGKFDDAWQRLTNRRGDLYGLMNRTTEREWQQLREKAFARFATGASPAMLFRGSGSISDGFSLHASRLRRENPGITPEEIWKRIEAADPTTFWSFVATHSQ